MGTKLSLYSNQLLSYDPFIFLQSTKVHQSFCSCVLYLLIFIILNFKTKTFKEKLVEKIKMCYVSNVFYEQ